jgi:flagellar hook-associated protein 2
MATTPIFSGTSRYASDFQAVITRAVAIASLPLQQLQNQLQGLNAESSALGGLNGDFGSLQTALSSIDNALGAGSYSASSSNSSAVTASLGAGATQSSYTLDVTSIGSYSSSISGDNLPVVSDPNSASVSLSSTYTLNVAGTTFQINPESNTLVDLVHSINGASAGVHASLVNVGNSDSPSYRLSIQSDSLGPVSIQLNDGSEDLLTTLNTGAKATYKVNGLPAQIESTSRTITLAPGVTANLLQQTPQGQPAIITVDRTLDSVSNAISSFVSAYNNAADDLSKQHGQNAGALAGDAVLNSLAGALRQVTQYTAGSGNINNLADIGIQLDSSGHLSFDSASLNAQNIDAIQAFLGSAASGGFLKTATDALKQVEDPTTGVLTSAISGAKNQITQQNDRIATAQQQVNDLQTNLQQQLSAADALIASLEQQVTYITGLFSSFTNNSSNNRNGA